MLLDKTSRLLERNREYLALGARRNVVRRHKDLGEVHVGNKTERKHRQDANPAQARHANRGCSTRLLGRTASRMHVPSAKRRRDHACRQHKHQAAVTQKRRPHGAQGKQQPVVTRKKRGLGLAHTLDIRIATRQATGHKLDGLHQQNQKRIGKQHIFGKQGRVVGEHGHKHKEQQDHAADRQAHAQLAQRRDGIGHAGGRNDELSAGVDDKTCVGAVEQ